MDKPGNITDYLRQIRENAWSSRQLGAEFERFVKRYFKTEPYYASQFSDVWLWSECPFAKGNDVGIDLVARTNFGEYVAIQAKCYQPGTQVDKADVDTFLSASAAQLARYMRMAGRTGGTSGTGGTGASPSGLTVIFSTYQSISAVQEAQVAGAFGTFDLIICDEAHRTTGAIFKTKDESEFVRIHDKTSSRAGSAST